LIGRVRHRATFTDLRARGVRAASGPITVTFAPAIPPADAGRVLVAFAVPRRVGNAVVRNLLRRRLRAIFAAADGDRAAPGAYLVSIRPGAPDLSFRELSEHVDRALTETARRARGRPAGSSLRPRRSTGAGA
jgi:ribonuclease P protein component